VVIYISIYIVYCCEVRGYRALVEFWSAVSALEG
jgi:hypothetical protein